MPHTLLAFIICLLNVMRKLKKKTPIEVSEENREERIKHQPQEDILNGS